MKSEYVLLCVACLVGIVSLLSIAAPVPKSPKPSATTLLAVMGKPPVSEEMKALVAEMGTQPTVDYAFWNGTHRDPTSTLFHFIWKKQGVELHIEQNMVKAVWLYNQDVYGHDRFAGELPFKLSFDDNLSTLAKKLGQPDDVPSEAEQIKPDGTPYDIIFAHYRDGAINVDLHRVDGKEKVRTFGFHFKEKVK
ncbi:MAG: hypothetical protein ACRC8S_20540 [Fimbriiglobus sp.]